MPCRNGSQSLRPIPAYREPECTCVGFESVEPGGACIGFGASEPGGASVGFECRLTHRATVSRWIPSYSGIHTNDHPCSRKTRIHWILGILSRFDIVGSFLRHSC